MASLLERYGYISNMLGSALVSDRGSIDWLCMPRYDSDACLAALLGRDEHGCWSTAPDTDVRSASRRYRPGTVILETFPQAFSHLALVHSASVLDRAELTPRTPARGQT
jgi:GH15 family glucan-1,4-alpha-glucosidase